MLTREEIVPPAITLGWDPARVLHADEGDTPRVCTVFGKVRDIHDTALPDLTDPATLGCLLALVREAWEGQTLCACRHPCGWLIGSPQHPDYLGDIYDTEAAALVAALEAAP